MNTFTLMREACPLGFPMMSAILGGIMGSFLGVVAERVPGMVMDEEGSGNLLFPASHCPVCQHTLAAWENIKWEKFTAFPAPAWRVILEQRPGNGLAPCWVCWSSAALALFSARSSGIRVHPAASRIISAKIAMLEADPQIKESLWTWLTGSNDLSAGY